MRIPLPVRLLRAIPAAVACAALAGASNAHAAMTFTGDIPADFGPTALLATQTRPITFENDQSEMNQLFARSDGDTLYIGITGNVRESSGGDDRKHGFVILIDSDPSSATTMTFPDVERLRGFRNATFDGGFHPKFALETNHWDGTLYCNLYGAAGYVAYLGGGQNGGATDTQANGGAVRFDNGNTSGVTSSSIVDAANAAKGVEIAVPLSLIGGPTGRIGILAALDNQWGDISNQFLPGLPDTYGALGYKDGSSPANSLHFDDYAGAQYAVLDLTDSNGTTSGTAKWAYAPVHLTSDYSVDAHPPITSTPTVYDGRTYVVGYNEKNGILFALDNGAKTNVTANVAWTETLDGAVTGRVAVKGTGGPARIYMQTNEGTVYMMDAAQGNLRSFNPLVDAGIETSGNAGSTTAATPAVVAENGAAVVYATVKDASGNVYLTKFSDAATPVNLVTPALMINVADAGAPSLIADGTRLQFGASMTDGKGAAFTVNTSDLTPVTAAATDDPVVAPPVLTLGTSQPLFFVGDAGGKFTAFNAGNANQVWQQNAGGAVSQTAFMDYLANPNVIYFATDSGVVNAMNVADGSPATNDYPATPTISGVTGGVTLLKANRNDLNGNLYVPTSTGLFVLNTGTPGTASRYPLTGLVTAAAAGGSTADSLIAVASANGAPTPGGVSGTNPATFAGGNVYGLAVR